MKRRARQTGFTIVELLIVIVVIAILAAISVAAYNGIQQRARDTQRKSDVATIAKALELYYADTGNYPIASCTLGAGCKINSGWSTTSDGSWTNLEAQLVPKYLSALPKDPQASTGTAPAIYDGHNYDYVVAGWCNSSAAKPLYLLAYKLESGVRERNIVGTCTGVQPNDYSQSEYIVVK